MSATERKVAVLLVVVLIAMVAVYLSTGNRPQAGGMMAGQMAARRGPAGPGGSGEAACPTGGAGGAGGPGKTEELGKAGAKLEIIAVVPVAKGCHAATIAELKKAYQSHPRDIHLTIVDLQGPDAAKYREKVGSPYTIVKINGKHQFDYDGRKVSLEKQEGITYRPSDLLPIIERELRGR